MARYPFRTVAGRLTLALMAGAAFAAQAHAQGVAFAASNGVEPVVVVGRQSVNPAKEQIKRDEPAIMEAVTAADIEKTPDTLLPDALSRLSGVSTTGFFGSTESGYVSIRGFDSRYNSIEVDGIPILFSSQNNRGAQIGMIPSAIVAEADVFKTVRPDQDANSIGGHIAMRTLRAFDGGNQPYLKVGGDIGGYEQRNQLDGGPSGRAWAVGKTTFGPDNRFGVVLGANYQHYVYADRYGGEDAYAQTGGQDVPAGNLYNDSTYQVASSNTSLFGKFEMRDANRLYAFVSGSYFNEDRTMYLDRTATYIAGTGGRTITPLSSGVAAFTNGQGEVRAYDYAMNRNAKMLSGGADYSLSDKAGVSVRGNYTDYSNGTLTRNLGGGFNLTGVTGTYDINGTLPTVTPSNAATYNAPANWLYGNTGADYLRSQPLHDKIYSVRGDFNYNTFTGAQGLGVSAGVSWVRLDRDFTQSYVYFTLPAKVTLNLAQIAPAGASMANNAAALMNWNSFWAFMQANAAAVVTPSPTASYGLQEDTPAAYAALHYAWDKFRVFGGVRYESTSDDVETVNVVKGVNTPVHNNQGYGQWLPNVQASYNFTPALRLRLAYTETLGRPDFSDFAPGVTNSVNANGIPTVSGSNADLGPRLSTNYDASLEYGFKGGMLSLGLFHKDIAHEEFSQQTNVYSASNQLIEIDTIPLNTGSAKVTGVEVSAADRRLDFLPGPLSRLGLDANYTYLDGLWNVVFTNGSTRAVNGLRNQPQWLANLQVSYDAKIARLNLTYQMTGKIFTGTFGATALNDIWYAPASTLGLKIVAPVARGLNLTFSASNLTNAYQRQTTGLNQSIYNTVGVGRSYFAGFRYEF